MRLDVLFAPDIAVERILCVTWNFGPLIIDRRQGDVAGEAALAAPDERDNVAQFASLTYPLF